jgi:phosphopantetheine--protein transferase-like protein
LPPVGNDIVDLAAPGNLGKSGNGRFLSRVFTAEERALIAGAARPDALLWALWAAKEAAYKAVSRGDPAVCSIPRQYRVVLEKGNAVGTAALLAGKVITPGGELALRVALEEDRVHALAAESEAVLDRLCQRVEDLDGTGDPSASVREALLREIARFLGCTAGDLSVVKDSGGPGAPGVLFRGRLLAAEASLSHDGRFAAFAFDPATLIPADGAG